MASTPTWYGFIMELGKDTAKKYGGLSVILMIVLGIIAYQYHLEMQARLSKLEVEADRLRQEVYECALQGYKVKFNQIK